jgi:hypothetical protein
MSDEDDDLFADSGGDTDDLIAESKAKPIAKKKTLKKKGAVAKKRKLEKSIPGTFRCVVLRCVALWLCDA